MMTIRSHDQYNTTVYGLMTVIAASTTSAASSLRAEDIASRGLKAGDVVDLHSHFEGETRTAPHFIVVEYAIRSCAATYFPKRTC
jgi:anaerobic selenocysteine-containing dehydrogenase